MIAAEAVRRPALLDGCRSTIASLTMRNSRLAAQRMAGFPDGVGCNPDRARLTSQVAESGDAARGERGRWQEQQLVDDGHSRADHQGPQKTARS